jgi:fumarate hydratase subunit alpha
VGKIEEGLKEMAFFLIKKAITCSPEYIRSAIQGLLDEEEEELVRFQYELMLKNLELAEEGSVPICQDTGIPVFFIRIGNEVGIDFDFREVLQEVVRKATCDIPLRKNLVHPLTRENTGDNCGFSFPFVWFDYFQGDYLDICFFPKGGGSENTSAFKMFNPTAQLDEIEDFIVQQAIDFFAKPCPPYVLGIGVGGTADISAFLSKKAVLRGVNCPCEDGLIAEVEGRLLKRINSLGIGPMGLGGHVTVLAVNIEFAGTHTASLPVSITTQCWPSRVAKGRIYKDGVLEFLSL